MLKLGVALGGGGAKGIAHIGVLRVLEDAHIPIHAIAGTSAGSLVGALYAAGKSSHDLEQMMRRTELRHWLARDKSGTGFFSPEGFRRIIENEIGATTRIEDLRIKYAAVAVEMETQQETVFTTGLVADAVSASCAFPLLLAPAQIGERHYLDGGLLNPVPFDVVRQLGAECVLAVDLAADEPVFTAHPALHRHGSLLFRFIFSAEQQKILRVGARAISIMTQAVRKLKLQQAPPDLIVYPDVRQIGLIDIDLVDLSLEAGERAMRHALPQLQRLLQPAWWQRARKRWRWE